MPDRPVLSDVDDTLVDSSEKQAWVWRKWAAGHCLDPEPFVSNHAVRIEEKLIAFAPHLTPTEEQDRLLTIAETCEVPARALPGAARLLQTTSRIALATSGPRDWIIPLLQGAGLTPPPVMVTAGDVQRGKPHPEPFLTAARLLGVHPRDCIVLEDAIAGVLAGVAAGMTVIAVSTTTAPRDLYAAGARLVVADIAEYLDRRDDHTLPTSV